MILAKNPGAETLDQGPKIKERILQAAVDQHVRTMSWKEVKDGHVMEAYKELVKKSLGGFTKLPTRPLRLNKLPLEGKFDRNQYEFISLSSDGCAFEDCSESHTMPLHEQQLEVEVVECFTCLHDPYKEGHLYHKACAVRCQEQKPSHYLQMLPRENVKNFLERVSSLRCSLHDDESCGDHSPLWTDEAMGSYEFIVWCKECFVDD